MGEGLRIVAEVRTGDGVHLFAVQSERAAEDPELLEEGDGFVGSAGAGQGLHQPEGARKEGAFASGEAVRAGRVAVQERPSGAEPLAYGVHGAKDAWAGRRLE